MSRPVLVAGLVGVSIVLYCGTVSQVAADSGSSAPTVCDCLGGFAQIAAAAQLLRISQMIWHVAASLSILGVFLVLFMWVANVVVNSWMPAAISE